MIAIRTLAAASLAALALFGAAQANAQERRGARPGDFDYYLLSLSWSPAFCDGEGQYKARNQCAVGRGHGFVVHGLWPQYKQGFPTECGMGTQPSRIALDGARGVYPEEGLARYQWRKHGACSGLSPTDYFSTVRRAREQVKIPPAFQKPNDVQTWTVVDLERAFIAANPGMRADHISVSCRKGQLSEVRICFTKDGRGFESCPNLGRGACRGRDFTVLPAP